jgi:hypothetical protein
MAKIKVTPYKKYFLIKIHLLSKLNPTLLNLWNSKTHEFSYFFYFKNNYFLFHQFIWLIIKKNSKYKIQKYYSSLLLLGFLSFEFLSFTSIYFISLIWAYCVLGLIAYSSNDALWFYIYFIFRYLYSPPSDEE